MHSFIKKNYLHYIKNCIGPTYKKPKPRKSAFIKNSSFEINRDPWSVYHSHFFSFGLLLFCLCAFLPFCFLSLDCVFLSKLVIFHLLFISVHPISLEVVSVPIDACLVPSEDWMGWLFQVNSCLRAPSVLIMKL